MRRQRPSSSSSTARICVELLSSSSDDEDENDCDSSSSSSSECQILNTKTFSSVAQTNPLRTVKLLSSPVAGRTSSNQHHKQQRKNQDQNISRTNNILDHHKRIYLDPKHPHKGWYIHSTIPSHLQIADRQKGFLHLLNSCKKQPSQVLMFGKMVDVPRFQQAYLADYVFTGNTAVAEEKLDPVCEELLNWCNEQIFLVAKHLDKNNDDDDDEEEKEIGNEKSLPHPRTWYPDEIDFSNLPKNSVAANWLAKNSSGIKEQNWKYKFNSSLVNWYLDGNHYMGPHADDETSLFPLSPIFSLSLGQTRTFRIRERSNNKPIVKDLQLRSNEFVVMGGQMQKHYVHEVVKISGAKSTMLVGPRVNVTFRCFLNPTLSKKRINDDDDE